MGDNREWRDKYDILQDVVFNPDHVMSIVGAHSLSDSDFHKLKLPLIPETTRLNHRQGGGIYGALEVFHQLHCVVIPSQRQHGSTKDISGLTAIIHIELYSSVHLQRILLKPRRVPRWTGHNSHPRWLVLCMPLP